MKTDKKRHVVNSTQDESKIRNQLRDIKRQLDKSERATQFRFYLSWGFATIAIGIGVAFSSTQVIQAPLKSVLAASLLVVGFVSMFQARLKYYPKEYHKRIANYGITALLLGALATMILVILKTEYNITFPQFILPGSILVGLIGFILIVGSSMKFKKRVRKRRPKKG